MKIVNYVMFVCVLAAVNASRTTHRRTRATTTTCMQIPTQPDPGFGNYGDLTCFFGEDEDLSGNLILRETVLTKVNQTEIEVGFTLEGYDVTRVQSLNFGRQHGFIGWTVITNDPVAQNALVDVTMSNSVPEDPVRVFVEIYGNATAQVTKVVRRIKVKN